MFICALERSPAMRDKLGERKKTGSHRNTEITEIDQAEVLGGETQRDA